MKRQTRKILLVLGGLTAGIALICGSVYLGGREKNASYYTLESKTDQTSNIDQCSETIPNLSDGKWIRYEQHKGDVLSEQQKKYLDNLVVRWTQGEFTDNELSEILTDYVNQQNIKITTAGVLSGQRCLFKNEKELPNYEKHLAESDGVYDFIGVHSKGEVDENGNMICYYWEAGIR